MKFMRSLLVIACIALGFTGCDKDDTLPQSRDAVLSGLNEVPANTSGGSGYVRYTYDRASKSLNYSVFWQGLTGPATAAHIHGLAHKGANAGIVQDFGSTFTKAVTGSYTNSLIVDGVVVKEEDLLAGRYYVNIHTAANPGGELRAQLEF